MNIPLYIFYLKNIWNDILKQYLTLSYMLARNKNVIAVTMKNGPLLRINIFWINNSN